MNFNFVHVINVHPTSKISLVFGIFVNGQRKDMAANLHLRSLYLRNVALKGRAARSLAKPESTELHYLKKPKTSPLYKNLGRHLIQALISRGELLVSGRVPRDVGTTS